MRNGRMDGPTDRRTDGPTDWRTDKASYRDAWTHLKKRFFICEVMELHGGKGTIERLVYFFFYFSQITVEKKTQLECQNSFSKEIISWLNIFSELHCNVSVLQCKVDANDKWDFMKPHKPFFYLGNLFVSWHGVCGGQIDWMLRGAYTILTILTILTALGLVCPFSFFTPFPPSFFLENYSPTPFTVRRHLQSDARGSTRPRWPPFPDAPVDI